MVTVPDGSTEITPAVMLASRVSMYWRRCSSSELVRLRSAVIWLKDATSVPISSSPLASIR